MTNDGIDYYFKTGDTRPMVVEELDGNLMDSSISVSFTMREAVDREATLVVDSEQADKLSFDDDTDSTKVEFQLPSGSTSSAGEYVGEFEVTYGDGSTETFPKGRYYFIKVTEGLA